MGQLILYTEKITVEHLGQQGQIESQYSMCDYCNSEQVGADEARFNKLAMNAFKKQVFKTVWYILPIKKRHQMISSYLALLILNVPTTPLPLPVRSAPCEGLLFSGACDFE